MGPYETISDRLEFFARISIVYAVLIILFAFSVVSVPYPLEALLRAPILLMAIYYWCIYRPALLPSWLLFVIGLLFDLLSGMPFVGLSAFLFLLCRIALLDQRRFLTGQAFPMIWLGFTVLNAVFHFLYWLIFSLLSFQIAAISSLYSPFMLGILLFPLVYLSLYLSHKCLPAPVIRAKSRLGSQKANMTL